MSIGPPAAKISQWKEYSVEGGGVTNTPFRQAENDKKLPRRRSPKRIPLSFSLHLIYAKRGKPNLRNLPGDSAAQSYFPHFPLESVVGAPRPSAPRGISVGRRGDSCAISSDTPRRVSHSTHQGDANTRNCWKSPDRKVGTWCWKGHNEGSYDLRRRALSRAFIRLKSFKVQRFQEFNR